MYANEVHIEVIIGTNDTGLTQLSADLAQHRSPKPVLSQIRLNLKVTSKAVYVLLRLQPTSEWPLWPKKCYFWFWVKTGRDFLRQYKA